MITLPTRPIFSVVALLLVAAPLAGACGAQETPPMTQPSPSAELTPEDVKGAWRIDAVGEKMTCVVAISGFVSGKNYGVHVETCTIPAFARSSQWRLVANGFEMIDSGGGVTARFLRTTIDSFASTDRRYMMTRAAVS